MRGIQYLDLVEVFDCLTALEGMLVVRTVRALGLLKVPLKKLPSPPLPFRRSGTSDPKILTLPQQLKSCFDYCVVFINCVYTLRHGCTNAGLCIDYTSFCLVSCCLIYFFHV